MPCIGEERGHGESGPARRRRGAAYATDISHAAAVDTGPPHPKAVVDHEPVRVHRALGDLHGACGALMICGKQDWTGDVDQLDDGQGYAVSALVARGAAEHARNHPA